MNSKRWVEKVLILSILCIGFIGSINYYIDPLWRTSTNSILNSRQKGFDERQQKTNFVYHNRLLNYDGILIGSSRTTFINQNDFYNMNVYNYGFNGLSPYEYKGYIDFSKEMKKQSLKYIIIGTDFFGTIKRREIKNTLNHAINSNLYIEKAKSTIENYKSLFSIDTLKRSITNIRYSIFRSGRYYDRFNVHYWNKISENRRLNKYAISFNKYTKSFTDVNYQYSKQYIEYLRELKNDNPKTKFIIFTSPITANLLVSILKDAKRIDEYERWLREIIEVFGEVHNFMTINTITRDVQNYPDADHYYPHIGKLIANKLSNKSNPNIPNDFGILLTKDNIEEHLKSLKKQIKKY